MATDSRLRLFFGERAQDGQHETAVFVGTVHQEQPAGHRGQTHGGEQQESDSRPSSGITESMILTVAQTIHATIAAAPKRMDWKA